MKKIFEVQKPIIGMIHLKPLPGSPNYDKNKFDMNAIVKYAVEEAKILEQAGVNGLQIENYWDIPFVKGELPPVMEPASSAKIAVGPKTGNDKSSSTIT